MLEAVMLAFLSKGKVEQKPLELFPSRKPRLLKIEYRMPYEKVRGHDLTLKLINLYDDSLHLFYLLEWVKREKGDTAHKVIANFLSPELYNYTTFHTKGRSYLKSIASLAEGFQGYCVEGVCFRDFKEDISPALEGWGWDDEFNPLFREKGRLGVIFKGHRFLTPFSSVRKVSVKVWDVDKDGEADILLLVGKRALSDMPYAELYMVDGGKIIKKGYPLISIEDMVKKRHHGWMDVELDVKRYDNNVFRVEVYKYDFYRKEALDSFIGALSDVPAGEANAEE